MVADGPRDEVLRALSQRPAQEGGVPQQVPQQVPRPNPGLSAVRPAA
jgi:hypothetical protein